jgi:hypothetical protein
MLERLLKDNIKMNNKVSHKDIDRILLARFRLRYWAHDNELAVEVRNEKMLTF